MKQMEITDVWGRLQRVFEGLFGTNIPTLQEAITADDIEGWDSLAHMELIDTIEKEFDLVFDFEEVLKFENLGDMHKTILAKMK